MIFACIMAMLGLEIILESSRKLSSTVNLNSTFDLGIKRNLPFNMIMIKTSQVINRIP